MLNKTPVTKTNDLSLCDKFGKAVFASMVTSIVLYHGVDSACKLYKMSHDAGTRIGNYFTKKKEVKEAEKAAEIK